MVFKKHELINGMNPKLDKMMPFIVEEMYECIRLVCELF